MRQTLSKRQQSKANSKGKAGVVNSGTRATAPKRVSAAPKAAGKAAAAAKPARKPAAVPAAKPARKAAAPVAKKPASKTPAASKAAPKARTQASPKPPKTTKKAAVAARPAAAPVKPAAAPVKPAAPARKPRPKATQKVHLSVSVPAPVPPPPPEPPRRPLSAGAIRAFEHAVKVFNRRQFEDAREMFESLKIKFPNDVEIAARSQMYIQVCIQKVAQSKAIPRNADELYDRGVFALNIGDFSQARQFFEKALRINPDAPHLLYSLAATHAQVGAISEALDYLRRTIQIQPRFRSQAYNDADFSELRENKQFLELLGLTSPFDLLESKR